MDPRTPSPAELARAIAVLRDAGCEVVVRPRRDRLLTVQEVAEWLSVSPAWVRARLADFPGRVDLGAGAHAEWRIPEADVFALLEGRGFSARKGGDA